MSPQKPYFKKNTAKPAVCMCVWMRLFVCGVGGSGFSTSSTQDSGTHGYSQKHGGDFYHRLAPLKVRHLFRART